MDIRDLFRKQTERNEEKQRSKTRVSSLFSLRSEGVVTPNKYCTVYYGIMTVLCGSGCGLPHYYSVGRLHKIPVKLHKVTGSTVVS